MEDTASPPEALASHLKAVKNGPIVTLRVYVSSPMDAQYRKLLAIPVWLGLDLGPRFRHRAATMGAYILNLVLIGGLDLKGRGIS